MADRLNKLDGKKWLQYSFSIWRDIQKDSEERKLKHPAMFPVQLVERLIDIYTNRKGQKILDPFMGSGTTLIAAQKKGMLGIGFEINKDYIASAEARIKAIQNNVPKKEKVDYKIFPKSAFEIGEILKDDPVDLCITSPPYWYILTRQRTADRKPIVKYSDDQIDIGNTQDYIVFLDQIKEIFRGVYKVLKLNKHCIVVVMDIRKKSIFYPFHTDVADKLKEIGFILKDIIIWDRQKEYNNMRPLGYPYSFIINKIHEYILIFKKP